MMDLNWEIYPTQVNKYVAASAAYRYTLILRNDGLADMYVRHQGDEASTRPIKLFTYKSRKAAENGAQRFENKHGYHADDIDRINRLCAMAWDEGRTAAEDAQNPYRKTETTED